MRSPTFRLLTLAALVAVYFACGKLGLSLAFVNESATAVWPPTGLALAAMLLLGYRVWPAILIGAFLVNLTNLTSRQLPQTTTLLIVISSVFIAIGNTLEALVGAALVRRFAGGKDAFDRANWIFRFVLYAGFLGTAISATIGVTTLALAELAKWENYGVIWLTWWLGDLVSAIIVTPLLVIWTTRPRLRLDFSRFAEALALLLSLLLVSQIVFNNWLFREYSHYPLAFLQIPLFIWAAFRFGQHGAATTVFIMASLAVYGTLRGMGPFAIAGPNEALLLLQAFTATVSITALIVAAILSEHQQTEQALRFQKSLLESQSEASIDGILVVDSAGKIIFFNRRFIEMWKIPQDVIDARSDEAAIRSVHDNLVDSQEFLARVRYLYEHPRETSLDEIRLKDGSIFERYSAPVSGADGAEYGRVWFFRDVTQRKRTEEERLSLLASERAARREAERADRIRDDFLATVSHELRTPLNAVLGWSQLLRGERKGQEDLDQGLETIERNARIQSEMINDLLDMSRIVSGKIRIAMQPVDLRAVVENVLETVHPSAEARQVRIIKSLEARDAVVNGDSNRLQQVIWNLLSNAIKFTPPNGEVEVMLHCTADQVELSVRDTGQGIKPEFLPHLFERFRQGDASSTRMHGGLGLGLAIVKHLTELHGGTVSAASDGEGHGATFTVSFPRSRDSVAADDPQKATESVKQSSAATEPASIDLRGVTALVVDDQAEARELAKRFLENWGATVRLAASAAEALESIQQRVPDVLISDIGMPGEDGYELLRKVRALAPASGGEVPAIALTAFARVQDQLQASASGFQLHLPKPIDAAALGRAVARLCGRSLITPPGKPLISSPGTPLIPSPGTPGEG